MSEQPTVGRIVHYLSHGSPVLPDGSQKYRPECRAAIVAGDFVGFMDAPFLQLAVVNPTGLFFDPGCPEDPTATTGGTWHWPERS